MGPGVEHHASGDVMTPRPAGTTTSHLESSSVGSKQQQPSNSSPSSPLHVMVSPLASRPKNRIRAFVEGMKVQDKPGAKDAKRAKKADAEAKDTLNLSLGDPTALGLRPPREALEAVAQALTADVAGGAASVKAAHGYQHSQGSPAARASVASALRPSPPHGAEDVYITSGCSQALQIALTAVAGEAPSLGLPTRRVLMPRPCFPLYLTICEHIGAEPLYYDLDPSRGWEADLAQLEALCNESFDQKGTPPPHNAKAKDGTRQKATRSSSSSSVACLLLCNPGNPTGHCYGRSHLAALCRLAMRVGIPIVADEVYADMAFKSQRAAFHPVAEVAAEVARATQQAPPVVMSCGAVSKRFLVPGWRLGWLGVYDPSDLLKGSGVREGLASLCQIAMTPNSLVQNALPSIIANTPQTYHDTLLATLERGAAYCAARCAGCPGLEAMSPPQGAMYFMPKVQCARFAAVIKKYARHAEPAHDSEEKEGKGRGLDGVVEPLELVWCRALLAEEKVFVLPGDLFGIPTFVRIVSAAPVDGTLDKAWDRIEAFCKRHCDAPC